MPSPSSLVVEPHSPTLSAALRRAVLPVLLGGAGVLHLVWPAPFVQIVPRWLPDPALLVWMSGVGLILGAMGLRVRAARRAAGWVLVLLLAAVLPANVEMLRAALARGAPAAVVALLVARLPVQPLLAWWVWRDAHARAPAA